MLVAIGIFTLLAALFGVLLGYSGGVDSAVLAVLGASAPTAPTTTARPKAAPMILGVTRSS